MISILVESYGDGQPIGVSLPLSSDHPFDFALASTIHTRLDYKNSTMTNVKRFYFPDPP